MKFNWRFVERPRSANSGIGTPFVYLSAFSITDLKCHGQTVESHGEKKTTFGDTPLGYQISRFLRPVFLNRTRRFIKWRRSCPFPGELIQSRPTFDQSDWIGSFFRFRHQLKTTVFNFIHFNKWWLYSSC